MSELRAAHPEDGTDQLDGDSDPYKDIIAEEAIQHQAQIEEMQRAVERDDTESSFSNETTSDGETTTGETGRRATTRETSRESDETRRPGFDEALRNVESQLGKETAEVFRTVLADRSRLAQDNKAVRDEWEGAKTELRESLAEVRGIATGRQMGPEGEVAQEQREPSPWDQLDERQQDLFRGLFDNYAHEQGYVRQDHLNAREREEAASDYVNDMVDQGLDDWGSKFGSRDEDGKFYYADDLAPEVDKVYDRIYDPNRGLSARDLYVLAKHDEIVADAKNGSDRAAETTQAQGRRIEQARRATVETRSLSGRGTPSIRKQGESLEQTIARAAAAAYRDLPEPTGARR